jgi:flagellar hook-basal body complex protein FliE
MDLTSAIGNLGSDYVSKVSDAMKQSATLKTNAGSDSQDSFDSIYNAVSGLVNSTNTYIQNAQQAEIDFALGNMTNTHELGVYQQEANLALQYTVAVRDKALESYKEIMNMQI